MISEQSMSVVARITKLYGTAGEVVLKLYDEFPLEVDFEEPLFVYVDKLRVPLFFLSFTTRGKDKAVAIFCDLESELRISEFIGSELYMNNSALDNFDELDDDESDQDELFFEDLVGYKMFDLTSHQMGEITNHIDYENNPIFIVDFDGVEVMVPANDEIIADIYTEAKVVEALIPEGLYQFYLEHRK